MKRSIVWIVLLSFWLAACATQPSGPLWQTGVQLQGVFDVPAVINGVQSRLPRMNYLLYLPEGYGDDPDKQWPLIFFLHGSGDNDYDSAWVMSYGLPEVLHSNEQPDNFEFIVVSPQAFPGTAWWDGNELVVLDKLLDEMIHTYQVDADRVYLTGLSMGGYGSWFMATFFPERFAAMASISGSGYRTLNVNSEVMCRMSSVPVWAIHGQQDDISDPLSNKLSIDLYRRECPDVELDWTLYPEDDHFTTFTKAYRDPALYDWFLQHTRASQ